MSPHYPAQYCLGGSYWTCDRFQAGTATKAPAAFLATVLRARRRERSMLDARNQVPSGMARWVTVIAGVGLIIGLLWTMALIAFSVQENVTLASEDAHSIETCVPMQVTTQVTPAPLTALSEAAPFHTPAPFAASMATTQSTSLPSRVATPRHRTEPTSPSTDLPTRLVIPAIGLDAPIVPARWKLVFRQGTWEPEWEVPDHAVGWHSNSALPGRIGNTVLSGHHNIQGEVFRDLARLKKGDEVILYAGEHAFHYQVTETILLEEKGLSDAQRRENARWIEPYPDERLTMVTCWPQTNNTHRIIVVALPMSRG